MFRIKINEMAYSRKAIMEEAQHQFLIILNHWVLVRYAALEDPENPNFSHWQRELRTALWNVGILKIKPSNSREAFRRALEDVYYDGMELKDVSLVDTISGICEDENISVVAGEYDATFKRVLPLLIDAMADGTYGAVKAFVSAVAGG